MTNPSNKSHANRLEYKGVGYNDYSAEMPHLDFKYDPDLYPEDLPDPQVDPVLVGAVATLQKVGVGPVELPLKIKRRDGGIESVYAKASLYGSVDDTHQKGLNFSRFYILMHKAIENSLSLDVIDQILHDMAEKQGSKDAYCKLRFNYRMDQEALRSRKVLPDDAPDSEVFKVVEGKRLSHEREKGHRFYACTLEGRLVAGKVKRYLSVEYMYGSTCPCSFTLAQHSMVTRGKAANGHSQRSVATVTVELAEGKTVWIEDLVEMLRKQVPTEVTVFMRRIDEQAQAELSGSNTLFTEDANRLIYEGLDNLIDEGQIRDFSVVTVHQESIHPYDAIAISYKGIEGGLR